MCQLTWNGTHSYTSPGYIFLAPFLSYLREGRHFGICHSGEALRIKIEKSVMRACNWRGFCRWTPIMLEAMINFI
jgi:hypothetical protein